MFRPAPGLPPADAVAFVARLHAVTAPASVPRKRSRAAVLAALARAGESRLAAIPAPAPKTAKWIVRIAYRSEGGEILAFHTAPMTRGAADLLASEHRATQSAALMATVFPVGAMEEGIEGARVHVGGIVARFVVLPSQREAACVTDEASVAA